MHSADMTKKTARAISQQQQAFFRPTRNARYQSKSRESAWIIRERQKWSSWRPVAFENSGGVGAISLFSWNETPWCTRANANDTSRCVFWWCVSMQRYLLQNSLPAVNLCSFIFICFACIFSTHSPLIVGLPILLFKTIISPSLVRAPWIENTWLLI